MAIIKCPECGKDVSDKARICVKCGYSIKDYINESQKEKVLIVEQQKVDEMFKKKEKNKGKKLIQLILLLMIAVVIVGGGYMLRFQNIIEIKESTENCEMLFEEWIKEFGELLLEDEDDDTSYTIQFSRTELSLINADESVAELREKYSELSSADKIKYEEYLENTMNTTWESLNEKYEEYGLYSQDTNEALDRSLARFGGSVDDEIDSYTEILNSLIDEINEANIEANIEVFIADKSLTKIGEYLACVVTFENSSDKTASYIKYTIELYDEEGNIIDSAWSDWNGILLPDEQANASTMVDYIEGVSQYKVIINEVNY